MGLSPDPLGDQVSPYAAPGLPDMARVLPADYYTFSESRMLSFDASCPIAQCLILSAESPEADPQGSATIRES